MIESYSATDREAWLALRQQDVTASDIGCLFSCHPYKTALELYLEKTGPRLHIPDNAIFKRGRILEDAVARAVKEERPDWIIDKATDYLREPRLRIGCTRDYLVTDGLTVGVMQTKTTTRAVFNKHWHDTPPLYIVLQNATEMMLSDIAWGIIAVLIIDPYRLDLHLYDLHRNEAVETKIKDGVRDFWTNADAGVMPPIDFERDSAALALMYPNETPAKSVDLSGDNRLRSLLDDREALMDASRAAEDAKREIDNEIKSKMGDAERATVDGFNITWKTRKGYTAVVKPSRVLKIVNRGEDGNGKQRRTDKT